MKKTSAVIFLVNSLSSGGAERVVANMANEYALNHKVFIITLYNKSTYSLNSNVVVYNLFEQPLNKVKKIVKLPFIVKKVDRIISKLNEEYDIKLISSHLIYSDLIARLSKYRKKIIHVIHVSYKVYDKKLHYVFKTGLQSLYKNVPVVTVSKGCEGELIDLYKIKPSHITTIYNPVNIKEIKGCLKEKKEFDKPYLLFVGRLDVPKRPVLAVEIFYQGKFYEKYNLVMVGVGPHEQLIKNKIKEYHLEDSVLLEGWQKNVYSYMQSAKMLINCSKNEAFPMTMIEAFASNCPVVSFDIDYGPNEILTGDLKKYLAVNNDKDDMIKKINAALEDYPDNLDTLAHQYDVDKICNEYLETYKKWNL